MTKTKKQLRAEAVERLKNSEYHTALDDICSMLGWGHEPHFEGATDALIDLLTDDANDDSTPENGVSDPDGGSNVAYIAPDSREKLEADAGELTANYAASGEVCDALHGGIIALLDRQAAITERECVRHHESLAQRMIRDGYEHEIWELEKRVKELTGERDELKEEIAKYEHDCGLLFDEKHKLTADAQKWADAANAQRLVAIEQADKVQELTAERDEWKARVDYLESRHCDWADPDSLGDGCMLRKDEAFDALKAERDELKAKVEELTTEAEKARSQRHPFADLIIGALDSRGNELKLQERVEKLEAERDKAREESAELYSDLVKASDEREHYREKCSKMATIIHDALMVMDEGMA